MKTGTDQVTTPASSEPDENFGDVLLEQMFELWIEPELARRGQPVDRSQIRKVLIEMDPSRPRPVVTLNDEVEIVAKVRTTRDIQAGEPMTEADFDQVHSLRPSKIGENSGWVCFAVIGSQPMVAFDFRYNRGHVARLLTRAREFLDAAHQATTAAPAVACDTAFSAAELSVQAQMMSMQQLTKSHWQREDWLAAWTEDNNSPASHLDALQQLHEYRAAARYADQNLELPEGRLEELLLVTAEMIDQAEARCLQAE